MIKGTEMVRMIPLNSDIIRYSLPEYFIITGSVVSIEVAPPLAIGAIFPKYFTITGVRTKVSISLVTLESSAITAISLPENSPIRMLDKL